MKITCLLSAKLLSVVLLILLQGCFSLSYADDYYNKDCEDLYDPFEKINRKFFSFNDSLDRIVMVPIAKGYNQGMPKVAKNKIRNFFSNLYTPVTVINYLFQLKFVEAARSFWKFAINSTIGIGGIHDISSKISLYSQKQSFGNTLAYYGVRPGAYVVLPILGSTNMRDMFDVIILDRLFNPVTYNIPNKVSYPMTGVYFIDSRASLLSLSSYIEKNSADKYITLRSMQHQRRESQLDYPKKSRCIRTAQ